MDRDGQLMKRESGGTTGMTYLKWGLMGVGAIVVAGWVLSLLSWALPLLLIGGVGYGVWRLATAGSRKAPLALPPSDVDTSGLDAQRQSRQELEDFERRLREVEEPAHRR